MSSEQAARTDTIILMIDGTELKLSVTTRAPKNSQENAPTAAQLARIRTGLVMKYVTTWRKAVSGEYGIDDFDKELKSPIRVVAEDENDQIQPSDYAPYCTIWQMGNWGTNQPPSLTLHDYDTGNDILQISAVCEASNDKLREIFNSGNGVKGVQLLYLSSFKTFQRLEHDDTVAESPTPSENANRIGRNAESLPDTPQRKTTQQIEGAYFHAVNAVVRNTKKGKFAGSISLESFEGKKQNFKTQAQIANQPFDSKAVQYEHALLVAYPITGFARVGDWNGQRYIDIPVGDKSFRQYYQERSANQEFATNWENLVSNLGMADESLVAGLKIEIPADYLVLKTDSEKDGVQRLGKPEKEGELGKPVQYKNFYRFYRKEDSAKTQVKSKVANTGLPAHHDLDDYFGDGNTDYANAMYDEIPF